MKSSRLFEIILAITLTLLACCLSCGLAGRLLLNSETTPLAAPPTATSEPKTTPIPSSPTPSSKASPTPTPVSPRLSPTYTPTPAAALPTAAATPLTVTDPSLTDRELLEQQFRAAQTGQELVLLIHDDHLEREIAAYLAAQQETGYRNVSVRFKPGLVELGGEVQVLSLWVPATVWGQVAVRDCKPEATITELEVGGFLTPKWAKDYIANLVYDALDRYPDDPPVCLESVEIREGEALVKGSKR